MKSIVNIAGRGHKLTYPLHTLVGAEQLQSKGPAKRHSHLVTSSCWLCSCMHAPNYS